MATYNGHNEDSSGNILLSIGNGMTATVETGTTASQAYTKGSYLFFNNRLCKATSAISSGATLAIGTNLSQTSIGQEITSHLRSSDGKEFYFDVKDGTYGYYPSASKTASEFVPFGGTALGFTALIGSTGTVDCRVISVRNGVATVFNSIAVNQTIAMPDGDMSVLIAGSGVSYTRTYTFIKAGYYCVNGTWSYKAANSTQQVASTEGYVLYYEDLKQH